MLNVSRALKPFHKYSNFFSLAGDILALKSNHFIDLRRTEEYNAEVIETNGRAGETRGSDKTGGFAIPSAY